MTVSGPKAKTIIGGYLREFESSQHIRIPRELSGVFLVFYLGRWEQLKDTPYRVMFDTLTINNSIFFFPDYVDQAARQSVPLNNYITRKYLDPTAYRPECYKYDGETREYSEFTTYPQGVTSISKTASYCPQSDCVTVIGGTHGVFATLNMNGIQYAEPQCVLPAEPQWDLTRNFHGLYETTGSAPCSIYIDGKFHMIGGHNSYYHEVWDDRQQRMKPVYKFSSRLKSRELVYCRRLDSLIMFGGCLWNERDFQQTQRFRYIDGFYQCRRPNDLKHVKWHKVKDWRLPHKMIGFGHLLLDDAKLLIFGGRVNGGALLDEVWMLDMEKTLWFKSTLRIPKRGKFRAHLLWNGRKEREVQLFQYGHPCDANQAHFRLSLETLMSSMEVVGRSPPRPKCRGAPMISTAALEKKLIENGDLSKNQKRKILKKLQKKTWKQYEQKQKRIELVQVSIYGQCRNSE